MQESGCKFALCTPPYNSSAYLWGKGFFFFMFSGLCGHTFLQELGTTLVGLYRILQCIKGCSSEHNLALNLHFFSVKYNKTIKKPRTLLEIKIPKFQCYGSGNAMHVSFFSQAFKKTSKKRGLFYLFFGKQLPIEVPIFNKHTYSIHAMQPYQLWSRTSTNLNVVLKLKSHAQNSSHSSLKEIFKSLVPLENIGTTRIKKIMLYSRRANLCRMVWKCILT